MPGRMGDGVAVDSRITAAAAGVATVAGVGETASFDTVPATVNVSVQTSVCVCVRTSVCVTVAVFVVAAAGFVTVVVAVAVAVVVAVVVAVTVCVAIPTAVPFAIPTVFVVVAVSHRVAVKITRHVDGTGVGDGDMQIVHTGHTGHAVPPPSSPVGLEAMALPGVPCPGLHVPADRSQPFPQ